LRGSFTLKPQTFGDLFFDRFAPGRRRGMNDL
jgi:hypothetical protein